MAVPEDKKNCHYLQNDPQRCKIKLKNLKFHFNILLCYGVIDPFLYQAFWYPCYLKNHCFHELEIFMGIRDIFESSRTVKVVYMFGCHSECLVTIATPQKKCVYLGKLLEFI